VKRSHATPPSRGGESQVDYRIVERVIGVEREASDRRRWATDVARSRRRARGACGLNRPSASSAPVRSRRPAHRRCRCRRRRRNLRCCRREARRSAAECPVLASLTPAGGPVRRQGRHGRPRSNEATPRWWTERPATTSRSTRHRNTRRLPIGTTTEAWSASFATASAPEPRSNKRNDRARTAD